LLNCNSKNGKNCKTTPTLYWPKYRLKNTFTGVCLFYFKIFQNIISKYNTEWNQ
jgi:hypothetical protein